MINNSCDNKFGESNNWYSEKELNSTEETAENLLDIIIDITLDGVKKKIPFEDYIAMTKINIKLRNKMNNSGEFL